MNTKYTTDRGAGWIVFSGVALMLGGVLRIFDGIWAFRYKGALPENLQNALIGHNLSNYGWLWLIVGIVVFLCGIGVMVRSQVARWIGVLAAALLAVTSIWWIPYYPVWSLVYIGIGILVMYGLLAYGQKEPA